MEKTKVKVLDVIIGKFDYDSIIVQVDNVKTEICFNKEVNISEYKGKYIYLTKENGKYKITPFVDNDIKKNYKTKK